MPIGHVKLPAGNLGRQPRVRLGCVLDPDGYNIEVVYHREGS